MDVRADFVIIGSGIAGLRAACALADAGDVLILTKADPAESNTGYAQGGIAAALSAGDSPSLHAADTIAAGDGLCDEAAVQVLVESGPVYVTELMAWGARFDRESDGAPAFGREAAHSVRRVLHARDQTGREIGRVLWERVSGQGRIRVLRNALVTEALVKDGCCIGVRFFDDRGQPGRAVAGRTLLATGGAGQVFRETTNPTVATGDGITIAWRGGARVADLEFVQFHPSVLNVPGAARFLLSEALRGEGARLVNAEGEAFMERYDSAGDLAPRDIVSRGIAREAERTGRPVFLTLAHLDATYVHARFPVISATCRQVGLDLARDAIPVGPAAHYVMGGVETDLEGRTSIPGLFAAGEVACTRVHGANRLASNSLLEGLVFGARAGAAMVQRISDARLPEPIGVPASVRPGSAVSQTSASHPEGENRSGSRLEGVSIGAGIRDLMWRAAGLFRDGVTLAAAVQILADSARQFEQSCASEPIMDVERWRTGSLLTVARLITRAALRREESRGAHFRSDFSSRDDAHWRIHVSDALATEVRPRHLLKPHS